MGCKAAETTGNINNAFGPGAANEQCSGASRSFAKGTRALKMKNVLAGHWKLTRTNWEQSSKLILLQLQDKLPKNSMSAILGSSGIWRKLERWKSSISGCLLSWTKKEKKIIVLSHLLSFYATMNHFLIRLWWVTKSRFYMTTGDNQLSSWT